MSDPGLNAHKEGGEHLRRPSYPRIQAAYDQMEAHVFNSEAHVAADMQFHFGILAACHDEILEQMGAAIGEALELSRKVTVETPGSSTAHLPLHKAVAEAIRDRDAEAAESAMRDLLDFVQSDIHRFLQRSELEAEQSDPERTRLRLIE